jgi:hypothetical protein
MSSARLAATAAILVACSTALSAQAKTQAPVAVRVSLARGTSVRPSIPPLSLPVGIVKTALTYIGVPYVHGGDSRSGLDCSGLVYRVFHDIAGSELSRGVEGLYHTGTAVTSPLHIGDLVFFDTDRDPPPKTASHVGVYIGGDRFVHAASEGPRQQVIISRLSGAYYKDRYLGARRVIQWREPVLAMTLTDDHKAIVQSDPFPSREPMTIRVTNGMTGGGPLDLVVIKDGREVISRRIVPGAHRPAEISLTPDIGTWIVRVSRIFKGRELQNIAFTVEE